MNLNQLLQPNVPVNTVFLLLQERRNISIFAKAYQLLEAEQRLLSTEFQLNLVRAHLPRKGNTQNLSQTVISPQQAKSSHFQFKGTSDRRE